MTPRPPFASPGDAGTTSVMDAPTIIEGDRASNMALERKRGVRRHKPSSSYRVRSVSPTGRASQLWR